MESINKIEEYKLVLSRWLEQEKKKNQAIVNQEMARKIAQANQEIEKKSTIYISQHNQDMAMLQKQLEQAKDYWEKDSIKKQIILLRVRTESLLSALINTWSNHINWCKRQTY